MDNDFVTINDFQTVDAISDRMAVVFGKYASNVAEFHDECEEMQELLQAVITQFDGIEILECEYREETKFVVVHLKLNEAVYGFAELPNRAIEKSTYFHFATSREAFLMVAEIMTF